MLPSQSFENCLGYDLRDRGHNRVPDPPASNTGCMIFTFGFRSQVIGLFAAASDVVKLGTDRYFAYLNFNRLALSIVHLYFDFLVLMEYVSCENFVNHIRKLTCSSIRDD